MAKKKHKKRAYINPKASDCHHILFEGRRWNNSYAKALRNHPYMKKYIPRDTLHREIHRNITTIPTPDNKLCRMAFTAIENGIREGLLDIELDTLEARLDFLIGIWSIDNACPQTIHALQRQRELVAHFYERAH